MSHFLVAVIAESINDIEEYVEDVMAPYDENITVAPYMDTCSCITLDKYDKINKDLNKKFGTLTDLKTKFDAEIAPTIYNRNDPPKTITIEQQIEAVEQLESAWCEYIKDRTAAYNTMKADPTIVGIAKTDCSNCGGTGTVVSTYNPNSKWDWYRIGGRWDGVIRDAPAESTDNGFNSADKHSTAENNNVTVSEYIRLIKNKKNVIPYAIVDMDGIWHEKGQMGWWGMSSNDKEEDNWQSEVIGILKRYPLEYIVVGVDCHI